MGCVAEAIEDGQRSPFGIAQQLGGAHKGFKARRRTTNSDGTGANSTNKDLARRREVLAGLVED